jgi:hypothetical protein
VQTAEVARSASGATATRAYEILGATVEKEYAIDYATADKAYHIGRVQKQSLTTLDQNRKTASADATLEKTTSVADAKLAYLQAEITARKAFTGNAAAAQTVLDGSLATLAWTAAINEATYEATLDSTFAQAEGAYWFWETVAENVHRVAEASSEATWSLAQENASITEVQAIDSAVNVPWTQYLVDRAIARRDWWADTADDYVLWVNNRNVAEAVYQASLSMAHINQAAVRASADVARDTAIANAQWDQAAAEAAARDDYFAALGGQTGAAQTFLQGEAQAERTLEVAEAQALHDYTIGGTHSAYNAALQAADQAKKTTDSGLKSAYGQAESTAIGTRHVAVAQAERTFTVAQAGANQGQKTAYATADESRGRSRLEVSERVLTRCRARGPQKSG